jgi:hypothetical protein
MRLLSVALTMIVAGLPGCAGTATTGGQSQDGGGAAILVRMAPTIEDGAERIYLTAGADGTLTTSGGCVGLRTARSTFVVLIWPPGTELIADQEGRRWVRNLQRDIKVELGSKVALGGGSPPDGERLNLEADVPGSCTGSRFIVSTARAR